ncbi:unnamed protein product [Protopolystoma xenopodis]|uniref:Uncharacterized protein n=1 Tax=Protopolystoma xenopodis TaxID=117903 RepID=A0A448WBH6_9PLAT|nr:unnamed protein product [Protopolystoma xenopodis]
MTQVLSCLTNSSFTLQAPETIFSQIFSSEHNSASQSVHDEFQQHFTWLDLSLDHAFAVQLAPLLFASSWACRYGNETRLQPQSRLEVAWRVAILCKRSGIIFQHPE